jgi:hypothetical protein
MFPPGVCIPAERDADRAAPGVVLQRVAVVGDRLRPSGSGRVLRADVTRHRQHDRAVPVREVADDADVASVGESAGSTERGAEGIIEREAEGEEQRPAPVVRARRIVPARE